MEQLTLEQAAHQYNPFRTTTSTLELEKAAFKAGAEWQKEQLKTHMQEVTNTLENEFAKHLVENITSILFS